jgi:hypothetical protein
MIQGQLNTTLEKYKLPSEIAEPVAPLKCKCAAHLENYNVDTEVHLPAKMLFDMLYGPESSEFWSKADKITETTSKT